MLFTSDAELEAEALVSLDERFGEAEPNDMGLSEKVDLDLSVGEDWPES